MLFRRIFQPLYTGYVVLSFSVCLIVIFPIFALLGLIGNRKSRLAIYHIIKSWSQFWLWSIGMRVSVSGIQPPEGRYIIVANHISYLDTLVLFPSLPGYFRALGKSEISKIPLLGLVYRQIAVMVDRGSSESRANSMRTMLRVLNEEGDIMIFPEGTFNETENVLKDFFSGAFRLAIATQTDILPVVFPDTVNRWHYSKWWKLWPGINRAIILAPISVAGMTTHDVATIRDKVSEVMADELKKYSYPA